MDSHDWSTPLVQFKLTPNLASFWNSPEAKRLRDLIGIKPDKFKGMLRLSETGHAYVVCTPAQFGYIIVEYLTHRSWTLSGVKPRLKMPPEEGTYFDLVHSTMCMSPWTGER